MIDANVAARLGRLIRESVTPLAPVSEPRPAESSLQPGQRFTAQILSRRPDGTYEARVGQRTLSLSLPRPAQEGEILDLLVERLDGTAVHARALPPDGQHQTGQANLSGTARLIGRLLEQPLGGPAQGMTPLSTTTGHQDMPASLAAGLQHAVTRSGLFYESHQAKWVEGRIGVEQLRREPQNRADSAPPRQEFGMTEHTVSLVQQQLETLSTRQFVWQGEAWPGQALHWTLMPPIEEEAPNTPDEGDGTPSADGAWSTRLRLDLPCMGAVEAILALTTKGVSIRLLVDSPTAGVSLASARQDLADRLAAMAVPLQGFLVSEAEAPHE